MPLPVQRQQIGKFSHRVIGQALENIAKPGIGLHPVESAGADERVHSGGDVATALASQE